MTQAQPAPTMQPMNRQQRRQAERSAKKAGRRRTQTAGPVSPTLQQAARHHQAGRLEEAERFYREVLRTSPNDAVALHFLGSLLSQAGRGDEALPLLVKASEQAPENADIWNNLGVVCAALGKTADAISHYETAIRLAPERFDPHKNLGILHFQRKTYDAAARHFEKALSIDPENAVALRLLGEARQRQGDRDGAAKAYCQSLDFDPDDIGAMVAIAFLSPKDYPENAKVRLAEAVIADPEVRDTQLAFEKALVATPPHCHVPEIEKALVVCLNSKFTLHRRLGAFAAQQIVLRYRTEQEHAELPGKSLGQARKQINDMLGNELLICSLRSVVNTTIPLELFLTFLRRSLLFMLLDSREIEPENMHFLASLALQCHNNSYVFYADEKESDAVASLAEEIGQKLAEGAKPNAELEARMVLYGLYQPLHQLPNHEMLNDIALEDWSPETRPLIQAALFDRLEEAAMRETIPTLTAIDDEVSQAVRAQYEENPYPRWISMPEYTPVPLANQLRSMFPYFEPPAFLSEELEILVAGCGTGQHPISTASTYSDVNVLAADLSLTSLAYAKRMAQRLGVENVSFCQGDILALGNLERQFPVIECAGVLHHMKDPDAGLASLVKILRPGGLLRLGLYSELARQSVVAARARIAELELSPSADNIRAFRRAILTEQELPGSNLSDFGDFFDLDSCRDLIFHVQEHRFTIPLLRDFLDRQSLRFIGFILADSQHIHSFQEMFSNPWSFADLDCWQQFEEANPLTFKGMYQFWCQKPF